MTSKPVLALAAYPDDNPVADALGGRAFTVTLATDGTISREDACRILATALKESADRWRDELARDFFDGETEELDFLHEIFARPLRALDELETITFLEATKETDQ
ncbi:hypothetical protein CWC39_01465 [Corynebacterium heidelbergense]|uniref:Uncharacterized protein n=2 Tax=Corynebacterium heidelbergense TaxID=2055947 RepID=A0A364VDQ1_9CORY|nr:hypothetical protein CWC39_01465 [Corynebacterium heidelbergense]